MKQLIFQPTLAEVNHDRWKKERQAIALLLEMIENKITGKPVDIFIEENFLWEESLFGKEKGSKEY
jgi:hypothetical protein